MIWVKFQSLSRSQVNASSNSFNKMNLRCCKDHRSSTNFNLRKLSQRLLTLIKSSMESLLKRVCSKRLKESSDLWSMATRSLSSLTVKQEQARPSPCKASCLNNPTMCPCHSTCSKRAKRVSSPDLSPTFSRSSINSKVRESWWKIRSWSSAALSCTKRQSETFLTLRTSQTRSCPEARDSSLINRMSFKRMMLNTSWTWRRKIGARLPPTWTSIHLALIAFSSLSSRS